MRRALTPTIIVALGGLFMGMGFRYLIDLPIEASVPNYLRSGFHAMGITLAGWAEYRCTAL